MLEHVAVTAQYVEHVKQKIAEIAGVQSFQPVLVEPVELLASPVGVGLIFDGIEVLRIEPTVLPAVDKPGELTRRPTFLVEIVLRNELLEQSKLIVGVEDRVVLL